MSRLLSMLLSLLLLAWNDTISPPWLVRNRAIHYFMQKRTCYPSPGIVFPHPVSSMPPEIFSVACVFDSSLRRTMAVARRCRTAQPWRSPGRMPLSRRSTTLTTSGGAASTFPPQSTTSASAPLPGHSWCHSLWDGAAGHHSPLHHCWSLIGCCHLYFYSAAYYLSLRAAMLYHHLAQLDSAFASVGDQEAPEEGPPVMRHHLDADRAVVIRLHLHSAQLSGGCRHYAQHGSDGAEVRRRLRRLCHQHSRPAAHGLPARCRQRRDQALA